MTPDLAQFSDWVLALLPRLFIYPGGLWMLTGVALARLVGSGPRAIAPRAWLDALVQANLPSVAIAWAALSVMPLPGASILPASVDRWVLAALLAVSLLLDGATQDATRWTRAQAGAAITLAILAPLAAGTSLVALPANYLSSAPWAFVAAIAAVMLGVAIMTWSGDTGPAGQVRKLAWLALALTPVFGSADVWPIVTLWVFTAAAVVSFAAGMLGSRVVKKQGELAGWIMPTLWLLAFLASGGSLLARP